MGGYVDTLMGANEKVLVRARQHWFLWFPQFILTLIIIAIIVGACLLIATTVPFAVFGLIFVAIPIAVFVHTLLHWANEEYLVTNRRIIQTAGIINKNIIDSSLEKINDVVLSQSIMGRIMDFGDLEILTSSELGINKLHRIMSPVKFKVAMLNAKEAMRDMDDMQATVSGARPATHSDIPAMIEELADLRQKGLITETEFQEKRAKLMSQI
ncbi:MAG: PH domain-containing protein [Chloroflexi bacterium]|nr:PH domain-containing protein [Chloroflexota bacterium]MCL5275818.1 PH domain-containing protein [Chloroflexota bacterium]